MADLDLTETFRRTKKEMSADLGEENVVLDLDSGVYYGMDGTGPRIWELLEQPRTGEEMMETLLDEYDVEEDRCQEDLVAFLAELMGEGLVEVVDGAEADE